MDRIIILFFLFFTSIGAIQAQWPMSNDPDFEAIVDKPMFPEGEGPKLLIDGGHRNFFVQWDFIKPFSDLATADGFQVVIDSMPFTTEYLVDFDIVLIITALPFDFTTKTEVTDEVTFTKKEINRLYDWVMKGGSLLVFSEHAPFDQAINPLLNKFGITSSIGTTIDTINYEKSTGWIKYTVDNGLLNSIHPIIAGRNEMETVTQLLTWGGSSLTGEGYTNLLQLSKSSKNIMHSTGVGPEGIGESQCLAGQAGKGKVVALGDSNGFTAMLFNREDGSRETVGMNLVKYDWKQFVLNTLHWLSNELR